MKMIFKVEKSDLVGGIKNFPIEVVEKMVEEQVRQGCQPNVEVFQKCPSAGLDRGGFSWSVTEDGYNFWNEVIMKGNFELFFEIYNKTTSFVYIIGDSEIGIDIIKTLEKYGGKNTHGYIGDGDDALYYIEPNNSNIEICEFEKNPMLWEVLMATYTAIDAEESVLEVSMKDVAKKFGVDVSNLRIKQ